MLREKEAGTKIKLCGMFRRADVGFVNEVKPDYCGFVLAEGFRRRILPEQAAEFRSILDPAIPAVGVFVDNPCEEVISYLQRGVIQMAQLHGRESEEDICYIKAVTGKPVIKAVKVQSRYDVEAWLDSAADYLLFDGGTGSGKAFDWRALRGVDRDFFLEAMETVRPFGVDLSSGVETDGVKDPEKMRTVTALVRGWNGGS